MSGVLDYIYDSKIFVDLYNILEIEIDASNDEIKTAYIKLAKKNHPDQGGTNEKFQETTRAYEILYNKEYRKEYDLYYLKKNMDEFKEDDMFRLKDDFINFVSTNTKPITKEELDELYQTTFNEYRENYKENKLVDSDLINRFNDIDIERKNMQIETSDDTLFNFIKEHEHDVKVSDVFEFLKYKNNNYFQNNLVSKEWGTLDSLPGYSNGFSSFMDQNEYIGSNLYSDVSEQNIMSNESLENLNISEYVSWKKNIQNDTKLTDFDLVNYLKRRDDEENELLLEVENNLSNNNKKNEIENFLKKKNLFDNTNENYDIIDNNSKIFNKNSNLPEIIEFSDLDYNKIINNDNNLDNKNITEIDDILNYMEKVKNDNTENLEELEKELDIKSKISNNEKNSFIELKLNRETKKNNNVRKREFNP